MIEPFRAADQAEVAALISAGLAERWGQREPDPTLNPDLWDIATSYRDATFLVGRATRPVAGSAGQPLGGTARQGTGGAEQRAGEPATGRIVAAGALIPAADGGGQIVRMAVASDLRRTGLGGRILAALLDDARRRGLTQVVLETSAAWADAIAFYQRAGFQISHEELGEFGPDVWFRLDLAR